jgi:hypothetical protein
VRGKDCVPFAYKSVLFDSARDHPALEAQNAANPWGTVVCGPIERYRIALVKIAG